jgi:hypothetical protein
MAESISPSQDKKRLKKCNFSREEIVLIQREVEKLIFNPWFTNPWLNLYPMVKYNHMVNLTTS